VELNAKKCNEMVVDFRKIKTVIPPVCIGQQPMSRVKTYKLLGIWIDDDLKWESNTEYIIKKATKRLYFLKVLIRVMAHQKMTSRPFIAVLSDQPWSMVPRYGTAT
jgi:hypothetical protein